MKNETSYKMLLLLLLLVVVAAVYLHDTTKSITGINTLLNLHHANRSF